VWQQTLVKSVVATDDGATVKCIRDGEELELEARWILDASGRDAFLGKQLQLPKSDLGMPKKFATFGHFHGVRRNDPPADGYITIVRLSFGWFWIIPLDSEKTSVGLVQTLEHFRATGLKPDECFEQVVATTPELQKRLGNAVRVNEFSVAGDYTYRYLENAGPRWMLIGDAAGFIDPIFSSGVMLAIKSGYLAANAIVAADRAGTPLPMGARRRYTRKVGEMSHVFLRMIKMFYNNEGFEVFMTPNPGQKIERAVHNLVAGNTDLGWELRLRVWQFYLICALQRHITMVPRLNFETVTHDPEN
jgi:flavin-dependent dehydrogenase